MTDRERARPRRTRRVVVAKVADVPPDARLLVDVDGREIGIFNVGGKLHAILNRCPHRGGDLSKGNVVSPICSSRPGELELDESKKFIVCPWHRWEFDLETGESWCDLAAVSQRSKRRYAVRSYDVEVAPGASLLDEGSEPDPLGERVTVAAVDPHTHRVRGPYRAEIIPVDVDHDYIVLTLSRGA